MKKKEILFTDGLNWSKKKRRAEVLKKMNETFNQEEFLSSGIIEGLLALTYPTFAGEAYYDCYKIIKALGVQYKQNKVFAEMLDQIVYNPGFHFTDKVVAGDRLKAMEKFFMALTPDYTCGYIDLYGIKTNPKSYKHHAFESLELIYDL